LNKEQKAAVVEEMTDRLKGAEAIFAVDYRGISVPQAAELRTRLAEADAVFSVIKNRLAKRALAEAGTEDLEPLLTGPTALTLIHGDPVIAAKAISTFGREHQILEYKGGIMDGAPLDSEGFQAIARLPGLDVLHGQLVGVTASPLTGLAGGLGAMMSGVAIALGQIQEQGLVGGAEETAPQETDEEAEPPAETEADEQESTEAAATEQTGADPDAPGGEGETTETEQEDADPAAPGGEAEEAAGNDTEQEDATPDAPGGEAEEASGSNPDDDAEEDR
jgi:large subunit ribosomal protein L10